MSSNILPPGTPGNTPAGLQNLVELVRQEVNDNLKPILKMLSEDLDQVFTDFDSRIKALEEKLGVAPAQPPKDPESPKEL